LIKYVTQNASEQKQEEATNIETNYRNTRKTSTGAVQQKNKQQQDRAQKNNRRSKQAYRSEASMI